MSPLVRTSRRLWKRVPEPDGSNVKRCSGRIEPEVVSITCVRGAACSTTRWPASLSFAGQPPPMIMLPFAACFKLRRWPAA